MKSSEIRERIGLSRTEWARALGVGERTVMRWENEGVDPGGLARDVMQGIENALYEGVDPQRVGRQLRLGIGALIFHELMRLSETRSSGR